MFGAMLQKLSESAYHVGMQGNRILFTTAEMVIGWLLLRQANIADRKLQNAIGPDKDFYRGKLASARFFATEVLPSSTLARKMVEASTLFLMDVPDEALG